MVVGSRIGSSGVGGCSRYSASSSGSSCGGGGISGSSSGINGEVLSSIGSSSTGSSK